MHNQLQHSIAVAKKTQRLYYHENIGIIAHLWSINAEYLTCAWGLWHPVSKCPYNRLRFLSIDALIWAYSFARLRVRYKVLLISPHPMPMLWEVLESVIGVSIAKERLWNCRLSLNYFFLCFRWSYMRIYYVSYRSRRRYCQWHRR